MKKRVPAAQCLAPRLVLCLALAACALPPGGAPKADRARIGGTVLAVDFPNGVTCRATVPDKGSATGRFDDCPWPVGWAVTIHKRNYLEPAFGDAVSPYADVVVTDDAGRMTTFTTPYIVGNLD